MRQITLIVTFAFVSLFTFLIASLATTDTLKDDFKDPRLTKELWEIKKGDWEIKDDGGNLGWVEVGWNPEDPRSPRGGFKKLENEELQDVVCHALQKKEVHQGIVYGPVQTKQGYHALIIANEFKTDRIL